MASIKGNILLNGINTATSILYPVITFPYAARVLLPEGIGTVNFLNSIISYIVLFTSLGIPMYAVKEVAKYRDDPEKRDTITTEILILSTTLCILGYISVWLLAKFVPQIHEQSSLFYILSLTIIFTGIGAVWFYQGVEDFKFITVWGIIVRTISAVSLFIFVRDSSDLLIYGLVVVSTTVGNNLVNFIHLRKYLNYKLIRWKSLSILPHIKPSLQVFILSLVTSLYLQLNLIMLGFMTSDEDVGYFTAGTKISHIGLTIISSLGIVLLPHCSHLIKNGDLSGYRDLIRKSLNVTLSLSWPMIVGLMILAKPITIIFCGSDFLDSIPVLYLNAPVILFVSLTNLMGIQILYPLDKINIVICSVSGGAISNLILNIFMIPLYGATGAAISTLIAEFTVLAIQLFVGSKYYPFGIKEILNIKYFCGSILMGVIILLSICNINSYALQIIVGISIGIISYVIFLLSIKDNLILEILQIITNRFDCNSHK